MNLGHVFFYRLGIGFFFLMVIGIIVLFVALVSLFPLILVVVALICYVVGWVVDRVNPPQRLKKLRKKGAAAP